MYKRTVRRPVTPAEMQQRVEGLHRMTQEQLDTLFARCRWCLTDPNGKPFELTLFEDAFSHALAVAHQHYDGSIPLRNYVLRVAKYHALTQIHVGDRAHAIQFADLGKDTETNTRIVDNLPDKTDCFASSEVDKIIAWADQAEAVLRSESQDQTLSKGKRAHARRARIILSMLRESVLKDEGVAVDCTERRDMEWTLAKAIAKTEGWYYCTRCHERHQSENTIGKEHRKYAGNSSFTSKHGGKLSKKTIELTMAYLRHLLQSILPAEQRSLVR